jgi:hypothetical protein
MFGPKIRRFSHLDAEVEINGAWEMIRENTKCFPKSLGYFELKSHKPWKYCTHELKN